MVVLTILTVHVNGTHLSLLVVSDHCITWSVVVLCDKGQLAGDVKAVRAMERRRKSIKVGGLCSWLVMIGLFD